MTKLQAIVLAASCLLFLGLYFGGDYKPEAQKRVEQTRSLTATSTSIEALLTQAKSQLAADTIAIIRSLENEIAKAENDNTIKVEAYKKLAGLWFDVKRADISGHYAEEVAKIENSETAWSIAGTTYTLGVRQATEQKIRDFCSNNAITAFENAISISPDNYSHKVNLALCYTENPPKNNPMKGILMLREYNEQAPDNVLVLRTLARLAIQTNQFEKAVERLNKAASIEPDNKKVNCLLVQAYEGLGNKEKAAQYAAKCIN